LRFGNLYTSPDLAANHIYQLNDPILVPKNQTSFTIYYFSPNPNARENISYLATGLDRNGVPLESQNPSGSIPNFAYFQVVGNVGCDGNDGLVDDCGVCGGNNYDDCRSGCDNLPNSTAIYDDCGVCGGSNFDQCRSGCNDQPNSTLEYDSCHVCGGDNSTCICTITSLDGFGPRDFDKALLYSQAAVVTVQLTQLYELLSGIATNIHSESSAPLFLDSNFNVIGEALEELTAFQGETAEVVDLSEAVAELITSPNNYYPLSLK